MPVLDTIEDCLELAVDKIILDLGDHKLFSNLTAQVAKGTGLTDRQYELLKKKLIEYEDQLNRLGYGNIEEALQKLRMPIREIDRSKSITLAIKQFPVFGGIIDELMLAIRFPFSNRMIKHIEFIKKLQERPMYDSKTKTHYVQATEQNVEKICDRFSTLGFTIDPEIEKFWQATKQIALSPNNHRPGIYHNIETDTLEFRNVSQRAVTHLKEKFGEPTVKNLYRYADNSNLYGLSYLDASKLEESLTDVSDMSVKLIARPHADVWVNEKRYALDEVVKSLFELDRFPVMVVIPSKDHIAAKSSHDIEVLAKVHTFFKEYLKDEEMAVLYRRDKKEHDDLEFNNYVTRHQLNNLPSDNIKVIFVSHLKRLPKPLVESNWKPRAVIVLNGTISINRTVEAYKTYADLVIHYTDHIFYNRGAYYKL